MGAGSQSTLGQSLRTDFYLIHELLTEKERSVRDSVRAFCDKEVIPIINDYWERAEVPFELIPKIAALNVAGGSIQGYGCPGMSPIAAGLVEQELARADADRKSTRLNSSHANISYAVFCLKKKKQREERTSPCTTTR